MIFWYIWAESKMQWLSLVNNEGEKVCYTQFKDLAEKNFPISRIPSAFELHFSGLNFTCSYSYFMFENLQHTWTQI